MIEFAVRPTTEEVLAQMADVCGEGTTVTREDILDALAADRR